DRAADHLVRLARVDTQAEHDLDGRVVLHGRRLLGETDRLERRVETLAVDLLLGVAVRLAARCHLLLLCSRGQRVRADPATVVRGCGSTSCPRPARGCAPAPVRRPGGVERPGRTWSVVSPRR